MRAAASSRLAAALRARPTMGASPRNRRLVCWRKERRAALIVDGRTQGTRLAAPRRGMRHQLARLATRAQEAVQKLEEQPHLCLRACRRKRRA